MATYNGGTRAPSEMQLSYIRDLYTQAAANAADLGELKDATQDAMVERLMERLAPASMRDVSRAIDAALRGLREQRARLSSQRHVDAQKASVEDGFYSLDGRYVKVVRAVHGSGNLYAKVWNEHDESWEMLRGGIKMILARGKVLTLDEAKQFGKLYGRCCVCSRVLTDEVSIENGIGPVCEGRLS